MSTTKPPRSMSLRDPFPDSDKTVEGAGSWDSLDWLKLEEQPSLSRSVSNNVNYKCLLESEHVFVEGRGVVLVNTDEAGTLVVTNFRVIFMSDETESCIALGTIPLATIEKFYKTGLKNQPNTRQSDKVPTRRLLYIVGKDMRIIVFAFRPKTKQRRVVYDALLRCTKPLRLWDLFAFASGPSKVAGSNPQIRLLNEYFRLLGYGWKKASLDMLERDLFTLSNERWRISNINSDYSMCSTYPFALIFPKSISDQEIIQASSFRSRCRLPVVSWCHPETGAVLARSSQPLVGLMMNMRSNADEKLVAGLCANGEFKDRRKLYIVDARPRKNALANGAMGGGSESSSNYFQAEVLFLGIDNIHAMRDSLSRLRDYLDTHGTTSSDGISSFLRHGGWTWGGGNISSMSASVSTLGDTNWLIHIQSVLAGSAWIAARVALESSSVLVHCSDGWDRTTQLISLANLLLDPFYRTFAGFQALVEKDWLAFGHPFADRVGIPTVSGVVSLPQEIARQSFTGSFPSSPLRQSTASLPSQSSNSHAPNNYSPIFLQWIDCISQLLRVYPFAFEFSSAFLVDLLDCVLSCRFGNFFCNSEKERQNVGVFEACGCMWIYLEHMRSSQGRSHPHYNLFYDPLKHNAPLLPPAAALAPTLWPQFHLRWSCPAEAQAGDIESKCRGMSLTFRELQMAKEAAEKKAKETSNALETLSADLRNEKQVSTSAMAMVKRASKESMVIKRAIQSLGCRVNLTTNGDTSVEVQSRMAQEEKADLCVSVSLSEDGDDDGAMSWVCESLCPLRSREGGCRWPEAACAQVSSQFVGLRANFDAFETLSIYDGYFDSK